MLRAPSFTYDAESSIVVYVIFSNVCNRSVNSRTFMSQKKPRRSQSGSCVVSLAECSVHPLKVSWNLTPASPLLRITNRRWYWTPWPSLLGSDWSNADDSLPGAMSAKDNRWHSPVVKASVVLLVVFRFCVGMGAGNVDRSTAVSERNANLEYGQLMQHDEWMKAELTVIYSKAVFFFGQVTWMQRNDEDHCFRSKWLGICTYFEMASRKAERLGKTGDA